MIGENGKKKNTKTKRKILTKNEANWPQIPAARYKTVEMDKYSARVLIIIC